MVTHSGDVTRLLHAWSAGDPRAFDDLLPLVVAELRRLAHSHLMRSPDCPTLQPTALVNEAYLQMVGSPIKNFDSRRHFFAFASKVLRDVLVDYVRARKTQKRGGAHIIEYLGDSPNLAVEIAVDTDTVLSLHAAISKLQKLHERQAKIIELRFFTGLTLQEIAEVLDWSEITIRRDWAVARRWLRREILDQEATPLRA